MGICASSPDSAGGQLSAGSLGRENTETPLIAEEEKERPPVEYPTKGVALEALQALRTHLTEKDLANLSCAQVRDFLKQLTETRAVSVVDVVKDRGDDPWVMGITSKHIKDEANVFVSYSKTMQFSELVESLEEYSESAHGKQRASDSGLWFWFDILALNLNDAAPAASTFLEATYSPFIQKIGCTVVVLSPFHNPPYLSDLWCLAELMASLRGNSCSARVVLSKKDAAKFERLVVTKPNDVLDMLQRVDSAEASTSKADERELLVASVTRELAGGGFEALDAMIVKFLRDWLQERLHSLVPAEEETKGDDDDKKKASLMLNQVAVVLEEMGETAQAEPLYRRALTAREQVLGTKHRRTLSSVNNMASRLSKQGKRKEAEALFRRALEDRESELGPKDPDTLTSVHNLAEFLQKRKVKEAEELFRRALAGRDEVLGVKHPDTLRTVNTLAMLLYKEGNLDEAEALYRRALAAKEEDRAVSNSSTATSVANLGLILKKQGKLTEAEELYRRELARSEESLGAKHPETLGFVSTLAGLLYKAGKRSEAQELYRRDFVSKEEVLGADHPDTLTALNNLAGLLYKQGELDEAEGLHRRALATKERVLGPTHASTLTSVKNLALLLETRGGQEQEVKTLRARLD